MSILVMIGIGCAVLTIVALTTGKDDSEGDC